jgi:thymidine kinase
MSWQVEPGVRDSLRSGQLVVIDGPMFSGKTSRLLELLERELIAGRKIELFKPQIDSRYSSSEVVTHKGLKLPAKVVPITRAGIRLISRMSSKVDVIGVDEAQFWPTKVELPKELERIAYEGKRVYVSVLNRDHTGEPFGNAMELLARADIIHSLSAVCVKCGNEAYFTQRTSEGKEIFGPQVVVGGKELYEPRCRSCYVRPPVPSA